jgi:hypothetical protein
MANELSLWAGIDPKPKTPNRQFERPQPGNAFTAEQRKAWGAEQDRLRAERALQKEIKPAPAKRPSRAKTLEADTSGSSCFNSLTYRDGTVVASFANPTIGDWEYDMSLKEAREWFNDESLGGYFNDNIR